MAKRKFWLIKVLNKLNRRKKIKGRGVGSGIRINYEHKNAKLEVYFQIPSEKQLKKLKITKFNDGGVSSLVEGIQGKDVNTDTYKTFIDNLIKDFSCTDVDSFDDRFSISMTPYPNEREEFLENHKNAKDVLTKAIKQYDDTLQAPLVDADENSIEDWEQYPDIYTDGCPFWFILIANGYETSFIGDGENAFIQWTFNFDELTNGLVQDVFNSQIKGHDIYYWIDPGMYYDQNVRQPLYTPYNLEEYLLYFRYSLTTIFEHQLDLEKIKLKEPLKEPKGYYDSY